MWLIALILFWGVLLLMVSVLQRGRGQALVASGTCPTCALELVNLHPEPSVQPPRSWEVLACPSCDVSAPVVQGVPGRVGWCPECRQHTLELTSRQVDPEPDAPLRVEVSESCHVCGHEAQVMVEQRTHRHRGKVIPFPGRQD